MFGWLKRLFTGKGNAPEMSRESLAALTRGIHHAASSTYTMLAQQYMAMMMQYFEKAEDGHLIA
jgi:hypothetical protein